MSRGPAQAAQNQLQTTNQVGATAENNASELNSQLIPGYTSLMNSGYLSPADEAAATTSEMGAATASFPTAQFQAKNSAAATGNGADLAAQQDELALEQGQTAGTAAANLQGQKMQNQLQGMYGLGNLSQQNTQEAESMYGLGPSTIEDWTNASPGWAQTVSGLAGAFLGSGGAPGAYNAARGRTGGTGGGTGGGSGGPCWVAAELYGGWNCPEAVAIRKWLSVTQWIAPFTAVYSRIGERWAAWIKSNKLARQCTKKLFDLFLKLACDSRKDR